MWDHRLHARLIRQAAAGAGLTVHVRLGFVLELRNDGKAIAYVYFSEMTGQVKRIAPDHRPDNLRPIITPREIVDNFTRWLDEGQPISFTWRSNIHAAFLSPTQGAPTP